MICGYDGQVPFGTAIMTSSSRQDRKGGFPHARAVRIPDAAFGWAAPATETFADRGRPVSRLGGLYDPCPGAGEDGAAPGTERNGTSSGGDPAEKRHAQP